MIASVSTTGRRRSRDFSRIRIGRNCSIPCGRCRSACDRNRQIIIHASKRINQLSHMMLRSGRARRHRRHSSSMANQIRLAASPCTAFENTPVGCRSPIESHSIGKAARSVLICRNSCELWVLPRNAPIFLGFSRSRREAHFSSDMGLRFLLAAFCDVLPIDRWWRSTAAMVDNVRNSDAAACCELASTAR